MGSPKALGAETWSTDTRTSRKRTSDGEKHMFPEDDRVERLQSSLPNEQTKEWFGAMMACGIILVLPWHELTNLGWFGACSYSALHAHDGCSIMPTSITSHSLIHLLLVAMHLFLIASCYY